MNKLPVIFVGVLLTFAASWLGLVVYPFLALGHMQSVPDEDTGGYFPPTLSGLAVAGQRVYAANGCIYCHSQQVRPAPLSTDIEKGLGPRRTVARDYLRAQPVFLGTMRTGPDLTNIGLRQADANWLHRHLYDPRSVTDWSIMPSYRFLYKMRKIQGWPSGDALDGLTGPLAPPAGYEVVPTGDAKALVAYLLSLKRNYPLPEAPMPPAK
ncbi:MAG: cbb3-type cytochrome c oxidase subunit II [Terrimicrobiaceae bacterium]|nr:cbb3-type cytochrome c oxidase subunit II [Terrimicrobiaceae bacterium]